MLPVARRLGMLLVCLLWVADSSWAQPAGSQFDGRRNYNVQTMNFDLWCQETQRYPVDRCDARLPEDQREFEAYRAVIERYELQYLMQQEREAEAAERIERDYAAPWERFNNLR